MEGKPIIYASDILDLDVFERLYREYGQRLYRFIWLRVGQREDAEDILATVFVRLWEFSEKYPQTPIRSVNALLYRIARNAVIDARRKRKIPLLSMEELSAQGMEFEDAAQPDPRVSSEISLVREVMRSLQSAEYEIIELRFVEGFKVADIAALYGISENSAAVRIHRAMKGLKKLMKTG
ncbi:sigma-70 family RNA polymerase sigma factor [Candidatus Uhrbacteria bacterium]|nr:sigma-70 family RNA polymerase sigma factor [Candidatus Uhrbacteria bacterium]